MMTGRFQVAPANAADRPAALALAFAHVPLPERDEKVRTALALIHQGMLDPGAVWLARDELGMCAALLAAPVAGGGAIVWPPGKRGDLDEPDPAFDQLCQAAIHWLRSRGAKLAQAMLTPDVAALAEPLLRNGFSRITRMLFLRRYLDLSFTELAEPGRLGYHPIRHLAPAVVEDTLRQTWIDTLDCPELTGARTPAEALIGHRGDEESDTSQWWLVSLDDQPLGILLLNPAEENAWDIAYLGVTPEARGQRLGHELVRKALFEAKAAGMRLVTVSVDERNVPARALYRKAGFEPFEEREVLLAILGA